MLGRLSDPPFTYQLNHDEAFGRLSSQAAQLRAGATAALARAGAICSNALAAAPDDPSLHALRAALLGANGDAKGATDQDVEPVDGKAVQCAFPALL